jgi:histidinol-phosphate aminotransferase
VTWLKEVIARGREAPEYKLGTARSGVQPSDLVKLNANENLFLSKSYQQRLVKKAVTRVDPRVYPTEDGRLEGMLAGNLDVAPDCIVLGNGSDQLIELIVYTLLRERDELVAIEPTFSMYRKAAGIQGVAYNSVPLYSDFCLNEDRLLEAVTSKTRMMVVCNPNNPTGNQFEESQLIKILESFKGLMVVDEAYVEYADYSMACKTEDYPNLVILRTFSKAYGLAGIRLGYALMNPELALAIRRAYQMPYTVSELSQEIGVQALKSRQIVMDTVNKAIRMREWLYRKLNILKDVKVYDSDSNFLLFSTGKPSDEVYSGLLSRGVMVRRFGKLLNEENCLRVTVAPRKMMDRFLEALREVLE